MPGEPDDLGFTDPYMEGANRHQRPNGGADPRGTPGHDYYLQDKSNPYRHFQGRDAELWQEAQRGDGLVEQGRQLGAQRSQQLMRQHAGMADQRGLGMANSRGSNPLAMRAAIGGMSAGGGDAAIGGGQGRLQSEVQAGQAGQEMWANRLTALEGMQNAQLQQEQLDQNLTLGIAEVEQRKRLAERALRDKGTADTVSAITGAFGGGGSAAGQVFSDERLKTRITQLEAELAFARNKSRKAGL